MSKILWLSFGILLLACGSGNEKKKKVELANLAEAKETIIADSMQLPVYDFGGLEPLLHKKDGNTYVINFWATWCKPCIEELPYFERINTEYKNKGLEVVLVSLDMPEMWESRLVPFIKKKNIRSKVVVLDDPKQNTWIPKVDETWSGGIPATLIYNKEKRSFYGQPFSYEELKNEIDKFIKN